MSFRTPKFIYFDLGNVLLFFDHHRAARQMGEVAGLTEDQVWKVVFEGSLEDEYEAGRVSSRKFYDRFCEATNTRPDHDALLRAAADIFELNVDLVPVILHLHRGGNRLGILSNTNEAHWEFISHGRYALVSEFFPVRALSYCIGSMKPEPRIFHEAARLAGVDPSDIFYTDDREEHVAAANAVGYDAVLFHDARQLAGELRKRSVHWNY